VAGRHGFVHSTVRQVVTVGRAIVAVHAIHLADGRAAAIGLGAGRGVQRFAARAVVLHPGNVLALLIGGGVTDGHARPQVGAMDADAAVAAADLHQQHGLGVRVGFVVGELGNNLDAVLAVFLRPVAL